MTGKMIFGNPLVPSTFRSKTGVDLANGESTLLIVCSTPESIKSEVPSIDFDLTDGIARRLKQNGIDFINPDQVASWLGDNGGFDNPSELARDFDADYLVHFNLEKIAFREENSPTMLRGRISGTVSVYQIETIDGQKRTRQVFIENYQTKYPKLHPDSADEVSMRVFQQRFLNLISDQLSRYLCDYRPNQDL